MDLPWVLLASSNTVNMKCGSPYLSEISRRRWDLKVWRAKRQAVAESYLLFANADHSDGYHHTCYWARSAGARLPSQLASLFTNIKLWGGSTGVSLKVTSMGRILNGKTSGWEIHRPLFGFLISSRSRQSGLLISTCLLAYGEFLLAHFEH